MSFQTTETIQRLWETFLRDQLASLAPEQRQQYEQQFEDRFGELLKNSSPGSSDGFLDLVGFGAKGPLEFGDMSHLVPDPRISSMTSRVGAAGLPGGPAA